MLPCMHPGCKVHGFVQWKFTLLMELPYISLLLSTGSPFCSFKNLPFIWFDPTSLDLTSRMHCISKKVQFILNLFTFWVLSLKSGLLDLDNLRWFIHYFSADFGLIWPVTTTRKSAGLSQSASPNHNIWRELYLRNSRIVRWRSMAEPKPEAKPQWAGQRQAIEDPLPAQIVRNHTTQGKPQYVAHLGT